MQRYLWQLQMLRSAGYFQMFGEQDFRSFCFKYAPVFAEKSFEQTFCTVRHLPDDEYFWERPGNWISVSLLQHAVQDSPLPPRVSDPEGIFGKAWTYEPDTLFEHRAFLVPLGAYADSVVPHTVMDLALTLRSFVDDLLVLEWFRRCVLLASINHPTNRIPSFVFLQDWDTEDFDHGGGANATDKSPKSSLAVSVFPQGVRCPAHRDAAHPSAMVPCKDPTQKLCIGCAENCSL